MAIKKNPEIRYRILDSLFRNPPYQYKFKDLLGKLNESLEERFGKGQTIGVRSLRSDLGKMQEPPPVGFDAPIDINVDYEYFYTDREFSIVNAKLSKEDAWKLKEALTVLEQFRHLPQFSEMESVVTRLQHHAGILSGRQSPVVFFDSAPVAEGVNWIQSLYRHIRQRQTIRLLYQPFGGVAPEEFEFSPYCLKEYNKRWYLLGKRRGLPLIHNLPLDRIRLVEISKATFEPTSDFDPVAHFADIIGVTRPADTKPVKVVLRFSKKRNRAMYVATKPLHASQELTRDTRGYLEFIYRLIPNPELEALLLSYGRDLEVVAPKSLRQTIEHLLKEALGNYR
jgi:predicted DNA-binding transcriptional regulator YafY